MKRGTIEHPKMVMLEHKLGVERLVAVGLMEAFWHWAAKYAPDGGVSKYSNDVIAGGAYWRGDHDKMMQALIESGWIDRLDDNELYIHDWHEHAEDAIHIKLARHRKRFVNGNIPSLKRLSKDERTEAQNFYALELTKSAPCAHKKRTASASASASACTPLPLKGKPPVGGGVEAIAKIPPELNTPRFCASWAEWAEHRRQIRKKLTKSTAEKQLARLARWGEPRAVAAIEYSIEQGYEGIYEKKGASTNGRAATNPNAEMIQQKTPPPEMAPYIPEPSAADVAGAAAWPAVRSALEGMVDHEGFDAYIAGLKCRALGAGGVWLEAQSRFLANMALSQFGEAIIEAVNSVQEPNPDLPLWITVQSAEEVDLEHLPF
jgi:hypothetical protein